jgi:polysaccharide deacetylase 2 family uncharacterized protein YibQ
LFKVPFAQRDVFLDHVQEPAYIRNQMVKLIHYAETHGSAVGIGHPHPETLEVLQKDLPQLKGRVKLVPASQIARAAKG